MQERGPNLTQTIRAFEWWEHKLSPLFATIYATAYLLNLSVVSLWPLLLLAFAALVPGAAYVSVINDLTDLEDDQASGKPNRLMGKSTFFVVATLACCIIPGIAISVYWRKDPLLLALYLAAWLAFSLYSLPPVRLKNRGALGPLADASGAHLFPTLLVVSLVYRWGGVQVDLVWLAAVGAWSMGFGLRGILWHQLSDLKNDEKIGLRTFVRHRTLTQLRWIGNRVIFPVEVAAFALILWRLGSPFALLFALLYALLEWWRKEMWLTKLVIVVPQERYQIVMHDYYEVFYPLALLLSSSMRYPQDALVIVVHFLLFPRRAKQTARDSYKALRQAAYQLLH